jgi:predicted nucleotidyltransferase
VVVVEEQAGTAALAMSLTSLSVMRKIVSSSLALSATYVVTLSRSVKTLSFCTVLPAKSWGPAEPSLQGADGRLPPGFLANVLKLATIVANLRTHESALSKQPIELMFGSYRRRLLAHLLLRPDEAFYVRELARLTGIPAGSIHRELTALYEAGLLLREHNGNQVPYQANRECPIYLELAAIFRKTIGLAELMGDALADKADRIDLAFVFGSMAAGRQNQSSDVDVMIIGDIQLVDVVKALSPVQQTLGREINPVIMTTRKFVAQMNKNDRFVSRLLNEPRVFIFGDEGEFAKLTKDWKAR